MANEHSGHRSRVRDRVRKEGLDHFQDYQVLEYALTFVIPYKDTNIIAHRLINKFGSFAGVLEADEEDIACVEGMGEVSAHFLSNFTKIYHFYEQEKAKRVVTLINPMQSINFIKPFLKGKLVEELYMVSLTPKSKVVSVDKITEGTSSEASVPMRLIIERMNKNKVSSIIIAHNHPKGAAEPSYEDNKFTKALVTNLEINGCHLIDHIIIGEDGAYYSYGQHRLIEKFLEEIKDLVSYKSIAQPPAYYEVCND